MKHSQSKINDALDKVIEIAFTTLSELTEEQKEVVTELSKELRTYRINMEHLEHLKKADRNNRILLSFYKRELETLVLSQDIQECETCGTIF